MCVSSTTRTHSVGREAVALAASAGLFLDPWQELVLDHALSVQSNGKWCHTDVGVMVSRQNGKGPHKLDTPIFTDRGWITFSDIKTGDGVYGSDGRLTEVVGLSEIYRNEDCYRVSFADGSSYVVGSGHLWHVKHKSKKSFDVLNTEHLASRVGGKRPDNGRMEYNWRVRCDAVVDTPEVELPIDPYLFGYWLGDGKTGVGSITVGHTDLEYVKSNVVEAGGAEIDHVSLHDHGNANQVCFHLEKRYSYNGFRSRLRSLGLYNDKRIPELYLTASIDQRKALLAGLMDSDGSIAVTNKSPQVEFTTSFPGLAEDFQRLARSLGIRVTPKVGKTSLDGVRKKDRTRFLWTPSFNPFRMPRKADKWVAPESNRHELMSITSIVRVPTVPTRCIQVAAEDGVYLVGHNFTPTHNSVLEALELWALFINEETVGHTAHNHKTSLEHFRRMESLIRSAPELAAEVLRFSHNNNDQVIELRPRPGKSEGARLLFGTRTKGAFRGLTLDRIICDEAMYVTQEHMTALGPTTMATPNPQVWFTGSAGTKESTEFGRMRARAIDGTHPTLFYAEWSTDAHDSFCTFDCEDHDDPYSQESWAKANPTLGDRIAIDFMESRARSLSLEGFQQEHLGVGDWPIDGEEWRVISKDAWKARVDSSSEITGDVVIAVATSQDRSYSCIAAAGLNQNGRTHVEITSDEFEYDYRPGVQWVVEAVKEICKTVKPYAVVIDKGQAGSFVDELEAADIKVIWPNATEYAQACGEFYSSVLPRKGEVPTLNHLGQPALTVSVAGADKKDSEDNWRWSKANSVTDITPLVAVTLASWGLKHNEPSAAPWVSFGGRIYS